MNILNWGAVQPDGPEDKQKKVQSGPEFGMKTEKGNQLVRVIVEECRKRKASSYGVGNEAEHLALVRLRTLAKQEGFEEASSEAVRSAALNAVRKR